MWVLKVEAFSDVGLRRVFAVSERIAQRTERPNIQSGGATLMRCALKSDRGTCGRTTGGTSVLPAGCARCLQTCSPGEIRWEIVIQVFTASRWGRHTVEFVERLIVGVAAQGNEESLRIDDGTTAGLELC